MSRIKATVTATCHCFGFLHSRWMATVGSGGWKIRNHAVNAGTPTQEMSIPYSQRLSAVGGEGDKINDVFVYGELDGRQHVIFFGGDVQNYPEKMEGTNARHVQWNIENTAALLHQKFPSSLVFVIKPTRMHLNTFSVYSNFVESNDFGCPIHDSGYGALRHLTLIYKSACSTVAATVREKRTDATSSSDQSCTKEERVNCMSAGRANSSETKSCGVGCMVETIPVSVVGFSKGCVVLNQLVYEIPSAFYFDCEVKQFLFAIKNLYWLDGGHSGGDVQMANQHAYITEPRLVTSLAELDCHIHVHVTPYQVHDPLRPWIGRHYRRFCKLLHSTKASFSNEVHFEQEPGSLENHFKVIEVFKP